MNGQRCTKGLLTFVSLNICAISVVFASDRDAPMMANGAAKNVGSIAIMQCLEGYARELETRDITGKILLFG